MAAPRSFYWHDYETWGADPSRDRAAQFAGLRTDADFNPIGEPMVLFAQPANDMLPQPDACLITGITPQHAYENGLPEADFFRFIHDELSAPGTCALGYNSIRFDDEVTRYGLYRNFFDPYAREWQNGNSRWDLIDVVRLARALRPEGINWPEKEPGVTSFKLEALTQANDIDHGDAHDALADVRATIAIARLLREKQPRLFDYVLNRRDKRLLANELDVRQMRPVLHVSSRYPARLGCIATVVPLARHPVNNNGVIVFDLRHDPGPLLALSVEEIRQRLFVPAAELPEGQERIPLKVVHVNRAPIIVPMTTMTEAARESWQMDASAEQRHLQQLQAASAIAEKIAAVYAEVASPGGGSDPDHDLYGGFLSDSDRRRCERVRQTPAESLAALDPGFEDAKLDELLFRYRARNWPDTLDVGERKRWDSYRRSRLVEPDGGGSIALAAYRRQLSRLAVDLSLTPKQREVVDNLIDWPAELGV